MAEKFRTFKTDMEITGASSLVMNNAQQGKAGFDTLSAWVTQQAASIGQPASNLRLYVKREESGNTLTFELSETPIA